LRTGGEGVLKEREPALTRGEVERIIREILATETQAVVLSNKLFTPDGLFNRLADSEEERRVLSKSPLFREALARLSELKRKEVAELERIAEQEKASSTTNHGHSHASSADT
jgi:hypothetical protein